MPLARLLPFFQRIAALQALACVLAVFRLSRLRWDGLWGATFERATRTVFEGGAGLWGTGALLLDLTGAAAWVAIRSRSSWARTWVLIAGVANVLVLMSPAALNHFRALDYPFMSLPLPFGLLTFCIGVLELIGGCFWKVNGDQSPTQPRFLKEVVYDVFGLLVSLACLDWWGSWHRSTP